MADYGAMRFWLDIGQLVLTGGIGVYVWQSNKHKATTDAIKQTNQEVAEMEKRLVKNCASHKERTATLESSFKTAPTHDDLGAMYDRLNLVKGKVDEIAGTMKSVNTQINLLVQHHLKGSDT